MRIMARYDFRIVATWESKRDNRTEFVYLLGWPDRETMADRWEKFLKDQEWIKIKKETGEMYGPLVGEIQGSHFVSDGLFTSWGIGKMRVALGIAGSS